MSALLAFSLLFVSKYKVVLRGVCCEGTFSLLLLKCFLVVIGCVQSCGWNNAKDIKTEKQHKQVLMIIVRKRYSNHTAMKIQCLPDLAPSDDWQTAKPWLARCRIEPKRQRIGREKQKPMWLAAGLLGYLLTVGQPQCLCFPVASDSSI